MDEANSTVTASCDGRIRKVADISAQKVGDSTSIRRSPRIQKQNADRIGFRRNKSFRSLSGLRPFLSLARAMSGISVILFFFLFFVVPSHGVDQAQIDKLRTTAYSMGEDHPDYVNTWQQILQLDPKSLEAHVMLGWKLITSSNPQLQAYGISLLADTFDKEKVWTTLDFKYPQAMAIAATVGRYYSHHRDYTKSKYYTELAWELSKVHSHKQVGDPCLQMQLATMFDFFPVSVGEADKAMHALEYWGKDLLSREWTIDERDLSENMPGAKADPFVHCMLSLFSLSFYYRADIAATASRFFEMADRGWPELGDYKAPHVIQYEQEPIRKTCEDRRIKLGVIAGAFSEGHSVSEDFGGVLERLDRNLFHVTYIYLFESGSDVMANFTQAHPDDERLVWQKQATDQGKGAWPLRWGRDVADMELDIILYLDLTMSSYARRMGMMRLAPVQLNTHGHPVTSGHDSAIIDYFVSWAEAELPEDQAQTHYTENLVMIPHGKLHQYYEPRILPGDRSRMDGEYFGSFSRQDFGLPASASLYLCMQKPFKLHPEFDPLVCGILQKDRKGHAVLHKEEVLANQQVFLKRLERAGCDMDRVHFVPAQPHHRLLALYRLSTLVLDSYPAGGCTTTREVLEIGRAVVTLPARLLGGRWTRGYYHTIGVDEQTLRHLIAETEQDYIDKAVALGTNATLRSEVEGEIARAIPNLFGRWEAVEEWQRILLDVSPIIPCEAVKGGSAGEL